MTHPQTVQQLFDRWRENRRDGLHWRLTERVVGEINGLPGSRGVLVATNGVLCLIERHSSPGELFEGHLATFIADKPLPADVLASTGLKQVKAPPTVDINELVNLA